MEKEELLKLFGDKVRFFRKKKGFTQSQLSDLANITIEQISKIERGVSRTRIETAQNIASGLCVELHELFVIDGENKPNPLIEEINDHLINQDDKTLNYVLELIKGLEKVRS